MKKINLDEINEKYFVIPLQNGKEAKLISAEYKNIKNEDIIIYKYNVPCPLCDTNSIDFSYDGKFFINIQLNCRHCGIYFRPIIKR